MVRTIGRGSKGKQKNGDTCPPHRFLLTLGVATVFVRVLIPDT